MIVLSAQKYSNHAASQGYCYEAVLSIIIGILSILGVIFLDNGGTLGGFGLVIAYTAYKEIKESKQKGQTLIVLGAVCSLIGIVGSFF